MDSDSKIVFESENLNMKFIFDKCKDRRTFGLCQLGSEHQVYEDKCMTSILMKNTTRVKENCKIQKVYGSNCIYRVIKGNVFLSSHVETNIYRSEVKEVDFEQAAVVGKNVGLFRIANNNVNFECGKVIYRNVQLPKV